MGSIWLTRKGEDNLLLGERFFQERIPSLMEPLMEIHYVPVDFQPLFPQGRRALIATSRHGLKGLIHSFPTLTRATPVFCVGPATAETAKSLKFKEIYCAEGDVHHLVTLVAHHPLAPTQEFVYVRGRDISFDLTGALCEKGLQVKEAVVYEAQDSKSLTPELGEKIQRGSVDKALFYSKRTAEIFLKLMAHHQLLHQAYRMRLFAISAQVASCFDRALFQRVVTIQGPEMEEVLRAVKSSFQSPHGH